MKDRIVAQELVDGSLVGDPFGLAVGESRAGRFKILPETSDSPLGALISAEEEPLNSLNLVVRSGPCFDTDPLPVCALGCTWSDVLGS